VPAEALLRITRCTNQDDLIHDKIAPHDWSSHSGSSSSVFVNASTWALMLTGEVLDDSDSGNRGTPARVIRRLGEPVISQGHVGGDGGKWASSSCSVVPSTRRCAPA